MLLDADLVTEVVRDLLRTVIDGDGLGHARNR